MLPLKTLLHQRLRSPGSPAENTRADSREGAEQEHEANIVERSNRRVTSELLLERSEGRGGGGGRGGDEAE